MDCKFPVDRAFLFHNIPTSVAMLMDIVKNTCWTIPSHKLLSCSTLLVSSLSATRIAVSTVTVLCGWMMGFISQ
jgi:hypothetical protein